MPDHRALQIIDAIVSNIGRASIAGLNVYRSPARPLPEDTDRAIRVIIGPDDGENVGTNFIDSWLTVYVDLISKRPQPEERKSGAKPDYDADLMTLRKETHIKIMSDITQGLSFVIDTEPAGALAPDTNGDGGEVVAELRTVWRVKYRSSRLDPSQ